MEVEYLGDSFGELSRGYPSPETPKSAPVSNAAASKSVRISDSMNFQYDNISTPDVEKNAGKKKKGSKYTSRGLRQFSFMVYSKLKTKGRATYDEIADEIISELPRIYGETEALSEEDEKNIRRRVYDALNVLTAMDIITKEKKQIWWKGLRDSNIDLDEIEAQRFKLVGRIREKEAYLNDLEEQMADLQNLMLRNKQLLKSGNSRHKGFSFPFILAQTSNNATVEIEISEDMQLVHCDFNSTPFSLHDDTAILKFMRCQQLPESRNVSQSSSVYSSSSSGTTRPFRWNSETTPK
ncbi:transcription factor-like protein DPB [Argentina anserina]|uniref:transcription factor-like protein DPB n=1 Tax=Argentina anserina TaxID=57926 RepID=UPI0021769390|nr:transcription factor-like protein DPB [Potentilla anserina]